MNQQEFFEQFDAIESPREYFKRAVAGILNRELGDLPAELREQIESFRLSDLLQKAERAIHRGQSLDPLLNDLANEIRAALSHERTSGSLKQTTPADEIRRIARGWERYCWGGFETTTLARILEPGERIESVGFREIKTSLRTITRHDELFYGFRPSGYSREFWAKKFTPEKSITDAEEMERREAIEAKRHPNDFAGPNGSPAPEQVSLVQFQADVKKGLR